MAIWCGQCQAKNEETAERCVQCGSPLTPNAVPEAATRRPIPAPPTTKKVFRYDPTWLREAIATHDPANEELFDLLGRCRFAVRVEAGSGGSGQRVYFLPQRSDAYVTAPEDRFAFAAAGRMVTIVVVRDARDLSRKAILSVETRPAPVSASREAQLAQYQQFWQTREQLMRQLWIFPLIAVLGDITALVAAALVSFASGDNTIDSARHLFVGGLLFAGAALPLFLALLVRQAAILLEDRDRAIAAVEAAMELAPLGDIANVAIRRRGGSTTAFAIPWLPLWGLITLGLAMVWLAVRNLLPGWPIQALEVAAALLVAVIAFPAVSRVAQWLECRALTAGGRELADCLEAGRECGFEPWSKPPTGN